MGTAINYARKVIAGDMLDSGDPARAADAAYEEVVDYALGSDADGVFTEVPLSALDDDFEFVSASLAPSAAIDGNTNGAFQLNILKYDASGANGTTIATLSTSGNAITAKTTYDFTAVAGTELLVDGGYLGLVGTSVHGTGNSLPASKLRVRLRRRS